MIPHIRKKTTVANETDTIQKAVETPPKQIDIQSNKTPTADIAGRAIKCAGKILLGLFTVPAMTALGTLSNIIVGAANCYHWLIPMIYKRKKICALLLSITLIPLTIACGGISIFYGLYCGVIRGVEIAYKYSLEPLKTTWTETKDALSGRMMEVARNDASEMLHTLPNRQSYVIINELS